MQTVELDIIKAEVYAEVGRLTAYEGSKREDGGSTYTRISTTESDASMLSAMWDEACDAVTEKLKPFLLEFRTGEGYHPTLELSSSFDVQLVGSIESQLHSFFSRYIVSRWYKITNKDESGSYGVEAMSLLNEVMKKIYFKKKPVRRRA